MQSTLTDRAGRAAELLGSGPPWSDLVLVVGDEPAERVPASRLLLAVASAQLSAQLRLEDLPQGAELRLPRLSADAARALVRHSCGLPLDCAAERRAVAAVLRLPEAALEPKHERSKPKTVVVGSAVVSCLSWLLPLVALVAYWPVNNFNLERGGFFMDDSMIRKNAVVVSQELDWRRLMRTDYWGLEMFNPNSWTHKSFRPLVVLSFRWNYLWHGFDSSGFHATNVGLHALASLQLGLLGCQTLKLPAAWGATLAALFAAHPVHTESVLYIVGRADILCTNVLLLAVQLYWPCTQSTRAGLGRTLIACLLVVFAGLCKETGFTFFGFLAGIEILNLTRVSECRQERCVRIFLFLAIGAAACCLRIWYTSGTTIARMDPYSNPIAAEDDVMVRRWSYLLVHGLYMKLLVWPLFLCYDYSMDAVPLVRSCIDVRLLLPVASYLAFFQAVCQALRNIRSVTAVRRLAAEGPILGLAILILSFLPMMNLLFPVGTMVAERLLYIPSAGFLASVISLIYHHVTSGRKPVHYQLAIRACIGIVLLVSMVLCRQRVWEWETVEKITYADGLKQLRSSRTQFNLANLYMTEARFDEATLSYHRSIAADPLERDSRPLYHVGQIQLYRGRYVEAEHFLHKAVSGYFSPLTLAEEEVWHDYALALWHVGRGREAVQNFQNSLITNPAFPKGYNNLACSLVLLGLSSTPVDLQAVQQGLQAIERALSLASHVPLYWRNAAVLLLLAGDHQAGQGAWLKLQELDRTMVHVPIPKDCVWEFYFR